MASEVALLPVSDFGLEKRKTTNLFSLQRGNWRSPLGKITFSHSSLSLLTAPPHPHAGKDTVPSDFIISFLYVVYLGLVASQGWVERGIKTWQPGSGCLRAPQPSSVKNVLLFLFPAASCAAAPITTRFNHRYSHLPEHFPLPPPRLRDIGRSWPLKEINTDLKFTTISA